MLPARSAFLAPVVTRPKRMLCRCDKFLTVGVSLALAAAKNNSGQPGTPFLTVYEYVEFVWAE